MRCTYPERGTTLIELLVVLVVLGIMAGVVGLAVRGTGPLPEVDEHAGRLAAARREAISTGRPVGITLHVEARRVEATAWPDGMVVADSALGVDPLAGKRDAAR
jgi:type II secretion system protein H